MSDHFDGTRFFNPGQAPSDKSLRDLLRWQMAGEKTTWPKTVPGAASAPPAMALVDGLRVTLIGHASLLVQVAGVNLLVDPLWSPRASPLTFAGPRRHNPPGIAFDALPPIHVVLLTHNHYDHLDTATLRRVWAAHRPQIVAPLGNDTVVKRGAPEIVVRTGDWGEDFVLAPGISATLHPSYHWSSRGLGDRRMALWGGFVLQTPRGVVYIAGDTGYGDGAIFHAVRERFGPPRVAILPIGAYAPRWFMRSQHVNPEEALQIQADTGSECALGVHWGTFQLTDEGAEAPAENLAAVLRSRGLPLSNFIPLRAGQVWEA